MNSIKRKVLIFHPSLAPYRVDFFNACSKMFNASYYFNLANVADQKFNQKELKNKCNFKCNYLTKGFDLFGRSFRLGIISIIKKEKPEIILCSEYGPITLLVIFYKMLFNKTFKIYTISDDSLDSTMSRTGLRSVSRGFVCRRVDAVIFPSQLVCDWHIANISNKMNAYELPIIHKDEVFRGELRKSVKAANENIIKYDLLNKKTLLFVGRLVTVKNLPFLIEVFKQIKKQNIALIIVGGGILSENLKAQFDNSIEMNEIHFTGRLEGLDLISWYLVSDIFILPSTYEPFGAVINEALLSGCFTLCSSKAGASSLINSKNGKLFNPLDEVDLLKCIEEALSETNSLCENISKLKKNKMPFFFDQKIDNLLDKL